jgi:DNA polymerase
MKNGYQDLRDYEKSLDNGTDPILKTYPGALFHRPLTVKKKAGPVLKILFLGGEFGETHESRDLLLKMILAMKLTPDEYSIKEIGGTISDFDLEEKKSLLCEIDAQLSQLSPQVVVTLGAQMTNLLLGNEERLSIIHGKFFPRLIGDHFHTQIVPLFHPGLLLINPGMKRTAWMDMQRIMDYIGKV